MDKRKPTEAIDREKIKEDEQFQYLKACIELKNLTAKLKSTKKTKNKAKEMKQ